MILASASPRRRELLGLITKDFEVIPSNAPEVIPEGCDPFKASEHLACIKAQDIAAKHPGETVIGADTTVICDGQILGKPRDEEDARRMLTLLSGKVHCVMTGVCIVKDAVKESFSVCTKVEFYPLSPEEIDRYIATGDPMDKAGAYGIQTEGALLVKGIEGDFMNVVGLPVAELYRHLSAMS